MRIQLLSLILLFSLLVSFPAIASDWVVVGANPSLSLVMYVDKQSLKGDRASRKFWQKGIYEKEQREYFGTYYIKRDYIEIDCNNSTVKDYEMNFYSKDGELIYHTSNSPPINIRIIPDSIEEDVKEYVCSFKPTK